MILNKGTENEANSVVGSYKYVSPEGELIEVTYTSGVDGFRAYGAHLPVGPPAAPNVPKSLAFKKVTPTAAFARPQFRAVDSDGGDGQPRPEQQQVPREADPEKTERPNDVAEQSQDVLFVQGRGPAERPLQETVVQAVSQSPPQQVVIPSAAGTATAPRDYYNNPELVQQVRGLQAVSEPSRSAAPSVVPVLQTVPQAVQTQPKVVPVLQRLVPARYQLQPQRQVMVDAIPRVQQPPFNQQQPLLFNQQQPAPFNQPQPAPLNLQQQPAPFNLQQQRPGPGRQFSIEPQQIRYVPNNQQGRYFQLQPPMQRTLGPPKY